VPQGIEKGTQQRYQSTKTVATEVTMHVIVKMNCVGQDVIGPFNSFDEANDARNVLVKEMRAAEDNGSFVFPGGTLYYCTVVTPPKVMAPKVVSTVSSCCQCTNYAAR
jgi:hypothetical protein